jgi:hypothetical protein
MPPWMHASDTSTQNASICAALRTLLAAEPQALSRAARRHPQCDEPGRARIECRPARRESAPRL